MTIKFYKKGDFFNATELTGYNMVRTRVFHGRILAELHPVSNQKADVYRLDLAEYIVEVTEA